MRGWQKRSQSRWAAVAAVAAMLGIMIVAMRADDLPADPLNMLQRRDEHRAAATRAAKESDPQQRLVTDLKGTVAGEQRSAELARSITQEQVRESVVRGSDFLLQRLSTILPAKGVPKLDQRPWKSFAGDQEVGVIALMFEALVEAGRMTGDPRLRPVSKELAPAVQYLLRARSRQTYSTALQAGALAFLPAEPEYRRPLARVRDDLAAGMRDDGGFGYSLDRTRYWDNSNTQFAVLGMWSAANARVEVPLGFWRVEDAHWRRTQGPEGGWGYTELVRDFKVDADAVLPLRRLPALTAAGLASLYVTKDQLGARSPAGGDAAIETALVRVAADFQDALGSLGDDPYYLYAVERVGAASGRKHLGSADWYRRGAAALVLTQREDGAWTYAGGLPGTALSILFLAHGGAPVICNVLEYGHPGDWDPEPRALARLTTWMSRSLERPLNWQVVSVAGSPTDWLDAPILLISGRNDPGFGEKEIAKLRAYVHAGGMIVSLGDGQDGSFSQAMKRYASAVVDGKYPMRKLPLEHPLYTLSETFKSPLDLLGINNGVREVWVHSPVDLGQTWEGLRYHLSEHWQFPVNLMLYTAGQGRARGRLESLAVPPGQKVGRPIVVARVKYRGNWDPETGAWPRLSALLAKDGAVDMKLVEQDASMLDVRVTPVAHITGTQEFAPDEAEKAGLTAFLKSGGVLIGDAAGGSEVFAASFEKFAQALAGQAPEALQANSPMFDGTLAGSTKIGQVLYRKTLAGVRPPPQPADLPEIRVWKMGDRKAILFSQQDITAGLLGTETAGIVGFRPSTAQRVAQNLVVYGRSLAPPDK